MKKIISAPARPKAHYNNAVVCGKLLFIATQPSIDWETGKFLDGDIFFQTRRALGYTDKFPRWAVAFKFEAEETQRWTMLSKSAFFWPT